MSGIASVWNEVEGLRIHARVSVPQRPGRPVLLVHGLGVSSRYWVRTLRRLGEVLPVFAPDLPGFGRSAKPPRAFTLREQAEVLRAWMDARGLERPLVIANSMGCQVAAELAARWPERVFGLVFIGPTYDLFHRGVASQLWGLFRTALEEPLSLLAVVVRDYFRAGVWRVWRAFREGLRSPLVDVLPRVRAPTLVVRGRRDHVVSARWVERVTRCLPLALSVEVPGGAHAVHYDAADELAAQVLAFSQALEKGQLSSGEPAAPRLG